jgi:hypothetical protein
MRMNLPGTVPPNVEGVRHALKIGIAFSITSNSTNTLARALQFVGGGGTFGGLVTTARAGAPSGSPKKW